MGTVFWQEIIETTSGKIPALPREFHSYASYNASLYWQTQKKIQKNMSL